MRKIAFAALCLSVVLSAATVASAKTLGPNELINPGWETYDTTGWFVDTGGRGGVEFPGPGEVPAGAGGTTPIRQVIGFYGHDANDGHIWQDVSVSPGLYLIQFSGYVKRYVLGDGFVLHPDWGWVTVELTVDDEVIWSQTWDADDAWHEFDYITPAPVAVQAKKDVHLRWGTVAGVGTKTFDVVLADEWDLEEVLIPEPASMLVLGAGALSLLARRRKA